MARPETRRFDKALRHYVIARCRVFIARDGLAVPAFTFEEIAENLWKGRGSSIAPFNAGTVRSLLSREAPDVLARYEAPPEPAPPGMATVKPKRGFNAGRSPGGRTPGRPSTPKERAHSRSVNYKHGRRAQVVTQIEGRISQLRAIDPDAPEVLEAVLAALEGGDLKRFEAVQARGLVESELIRRKAVKTLGVDGLTQREVLFNGAGKAVGERIRAHPLLEHVRNLSEQLGITATDMQLTRRSRGEGDRDNAIAQLIKRDGMLRGYSKELCPVPEGGFAAGPPPPPEDEITESEVVGAAGAD